MREVVIVSAARTAVGSFGGSLKVIPASDLGVIAAKEAIKRAGIQPEQLDEVILGNVLTTAQGQNPARQVVIKSGIPQEVPAMTINKVCASGLRSVTLASQIIGVGDADIMMAGGIENMSWAPYAMTGARWGERMGDGKLLDTMVHDGLWEIFNDYHMGITAENLAEKYSISREEQDEFALNSQQKAGAAIDGGYFEEEIVPVEIPQLGTIAVLDDITCLKELDAIKSQFVETVSHDLKNPLTVISGFADIVINDEDLSETGRTCVDGILHNAEHMQELVQELLDLAQIESGVNERVEWCDMGDIVEEVVLNHKFQANEKQLALDFTLPDDTVKVSGNPLRFFQVVSNLVSNAIKITPAGGEINVDLEKNGSEIWLRVADNGPGISRAAQSQLFQKFYRVPEVKIAQDGARSTGLGLSIVKAIVEQYDGRVWVESEVGRGSTFNCAFPVVAEPNT